VIRRRGETLRLLDLFCGRWGWSREFAKRGWECVGVDMQEPPEIPQNCQWLGRDVLTLSAKWIAENGFDFICASPPCEEFSVWGMPHFHPHPKYPALGIRLFNHTREICEKTDLPYVIENVRSAQLFVGPPTSHCGPFYLWGSKGVPVLLPQGIRKGMVMGAYSLINELKRNGDREAIKAYRRKFDLTWNSSKSPERKEATARAATIPPELAACVAEYATRICGHAPDKTQEVWPCAKEAVLVSPIEAASVEGSHL